MIHRDKPIVKMNGKKINDKQKLKSRMNTASPIKNELAATIDKNRETSSFIADHHKKNMESSSKKIQFIQIVKPLTIAISLAVIIGTIFGFIMLKIFGTIDNGMISQGNNPIVSVENSSEKEENAKKDVMKTELPGIQAYILQGGVFSSKENAEKFADDFQGNGVMTMIWKRDNEFFLILGLSHSLKEANKMAANIEENNLDVFVKEWETPTREIKVTKDEEEWIHSFQMTLNTAIERLDNPKNDSFAEWDDLLKNIPNQSESLSSFEELIHELLNNEKENNDSKSFTQKDLLKIWLQYENLAALD